MIDSRSKDLLNLKGITIDDSRWRPIEAALGLTFPLDYKRAIQQFGMRYWSEFFFFLDPFQDDPEANLYGVSKEILDAERTMRAEFPYHYIHPLHPEPGGLFPWARTDNGDTLFWITQGEPDDWPTLIKGPRAPEYEVHFSRCTFIAYQLASGSIRSTILAKSK